MNKLIKFFVIAILATFSYTTFAQSFGIKGGLNMANLLIKDADETYSDDLKMKPGAHLGVVAEIPFNDIIAVETGLLFSMKGYKAEEDIMGETYKETLSLSYLDIPINLKVGGDIGGAKLFGLAGPYIGIGIAGKNKGEFAGETEEDDVKWGNDAAEHDLKRLDFGVGFGAGAEFGPIGVSVLYNLGLANTSPDSDNDFKINNKNLQVSVAYFFGR